MHKTVLDMSPGMSLSSLFESPEFNIHHILNSLLEESALSIERWQTKAPLINSTSLGDISTVEFNSNLGGSNGEVKVDLILD